MSWRSTGARAAFYGVLGVVMTLILLDVLGSLLPRSLATAVSYNSEGYTAALILGGWIEFVRPRLVGRRVAWPATVLAGAVLAVIGVLLYNSDLPSRFKTLNEACVALALLVVFVQLSRPLPRELAIGLPALLLLVVVVFNRGEYVVSLAEAFGLVLLAPIAFDVVDRGILEPDARTSDARRYGWYALLVALPLIASLTYHQRIFTGVMAEAVRYDVRLHESFVGIILLELYFAVGLGRTGRRQRDDTPAGRGGTSRHTAAAG